jgi:hypothetical protein
MRIFVMWISMSMLMLCLASVEDFFAKEKLSDAQQQALIDMGLSTVEDLCVLNDAELLRSAGVPQITSLRISRKIQSHELPF